MPIPRLVVLALSLSLLTTLLVSPAGAQAPEAPIPPIPDAYRITSTHGARRVRAAAPSWCRPGFEPMEARRATANRLRDWIGLRRIAEGGNTSFNLARSLGDLTKIARFACSFPDDPNQRAWLASYRQLIVNETELPTAGIQALFAHALGASDRRATLSCAGYAQDGQMPAPTRAEHTAVGTFVCRSRGVQGA